MPRVTHDAEDKVLACPECDTAGDIYRRTHRGNAYVGNPDEEFSCGRCSASFSEPVERPTKPPSGGGRRSKLERMLEGGATS